MTPTDSSPDSSEGRTDKGGSATDKLVQTAKDLGLPPQAEEIIRSADKAITDAVHKAAAFAGENREKFAEYVDKAGDFIDEKTEGKYHDKVAKAKGAATSAYTKFAEHGADHSTDTTTDTTPSEDGPAAGSQSEDAASVSATEDAPAFTAPSAVGEDALAEPASTGDDPTGDDPTGDDADSTVDKG